MHSKHLRITRLLQKLKKEMANLEYYNEKRLFKYLFSSVVGPLDDAIKWDFD